MNPVATVHSDTNINRYHRSSLRVTKQLRWLQLAEIEYCRVTKAPSSSSQQSGGPSSYPSLPTRSFLKWEVAQRTTPSSTAEEESSGNGLSGASSSSPPHNASAVEIMAIVTDHRVVNNTAAQQDQDASPPLPPQGPPTAALTTGTSLSLSSSPPPPSPQHPRTYLVLVSQYRPPIDAISLEFPAGLVDLEDASPAVTAAREMKEETGYRVTIPRALQGGGGGSSCSDGHDEMLANDDEDATVTHVTTTPLSYDPGLTDSLFHMVKMKVHLRDDDDRGDNLRNTNEDDPRHKAQQQRAASNCDPVPELDGEEDIVVHLLPLWISKKTNTANNPPPTIASRLEGLRVQLGPRTVVMGNVHCYVEGIDQARSMLV